MYCYGESVQENANMKFSKVLIAFPLEIYIKCKMSILFPISLLWNEGQYFLPVHTRPTIDLSKVGYFIIFLLDNFEIYAFKYGLN